jgi:multiple sugar transport system substrate-binding protein
MAHEETTATPGTFSRRTALRLGGAALASAATGPFVFTPARAQGFNWKRFQGKELFLILSKHPWVEVLEKNVPEFEALSGMKIKWETLPEIQARQKLVVEMTSASGGVDGFFTSLHVEKKRFWKAGWYEPLNRFLQDRTLTPPDWDFDDIAGGAKSIITQKDGSISALPAFVFRPLHTVRMITPTFMERKVTATNGWSSVASGERSRGRLPRNVYGFVLKQMEK